MTLDVKNIKYVFIFSVNLGRREDRKEKNISGSTKGTMTWYTDGGENSGNEVYSSSAKTSIVPILVLNHLLGRNPSNSCLLSSSIIQKLQGYDNHNHLIVKQLLKYLTQFKISAKHARKCYSVIHPLYHGATEMDVRTPWNTWKWNCRFLWKKGTSIHFMGPEPMYCISRSMMSSRVHKWVNEEHRRKWWATPGHVLSKRLIRTRS